MEFPSGPSRERASTTVGDALSPRMTLLVILSYDGVQGSLIFSTPVQHDLPYNRNDEPKAIQGFGVRELHANDTDPKPPDAELSFPFMREPVGLKARNPCRHPFGAASQPGVGGALARPGLLQRRSARPLKFVANDPLPFHHSSARCMYSESPV